jgi:hypothetical protein
MTKKGSPADERDRHRMGAHAVARDAARGVGGAQNRRVLIGQAVWRATTSRDAVIRQDG